MADMALTVDKKVAAKGVSDLKHSRQLVLEILPRGGPNPESYDRKEFSMKRLRPRFNELPETLDSIDRA